MSVVLGLLYCIINNWSRRRIKKVLTEKIKLLRERTLPRNTGGGEAEVENFFFFTLIVHNEDD